MGDGARVAVIDSGVNLDHPHIRGVGDVIAGPTVNGDGAALESVDQLGHGTAVTAAILDLAPRATVYSVRCFVDTFDCPFEDVLHAIDVALEWGADWINLSLGTTSPEYIPQLVASIERARDAGACLVAPASAGGLPSYPGSLEGTVPVIVDPNIPREAPVEREIHGRRYWFASPHPRAIEDVPREANWSGISFATANVTGALARSLGP